MSPRVCGPPWRAAAGVRSGPKGYHTPGGVVIGRAGRNRIHGPVFTTKAPVWAVGDGFYIPPHLQNVTSYVTVRLALALNKATGKTVRIDGKGALAKSAPGGRGEFLKVWRGK